MKFVGGSWEVPGRFLEVILEVPGAGRFIVNSPNFTLVKLFMNFKSADWKYHCSVDANSYNIYHLYFQA